MLLVALQEAMPSAVLKTIVRSNSEAKKRTLTIIIISVCLCAFSVILCVIKIICGICGKCFTRIKPNFVIDY
jgi:hypothetical protein